MAIKKKPIAKKKQFWGDEVPKTRVRGGEEVICPRCGSNKTRKKGSRERKDDSAQRFECTACEYRFTPNQIRRTFVGQPLHQTGRTLIPIDESRFALKPGKRIVHHPGGKDTDYYEYRRNRTDINPKKGL
jgi:hypothetical protein